MGGRGRVYFRTERLVPESQDETKLSSVSKTSHLARRRVKIQENDSSAPLEGHGLEDRDDVRRHQTGHKQETGLFTFREDRRTRNWSEAGLRGPADQNQSCSVQPLDGNIFMGQSVLPTLLEALSHKRCWQINRGERPLQLTSAELPMNTSYTAIMLR